MTHKTKGQNNANTHQIMQSMLLQVTLCCLEFCLVCKIIEDKADDNDFDDGNNAGKTDERVRMENVPARRAAVKSHPKIGKK
jgi:hypothetical protein